MKRLFAYIIVATFVLMLALPVQGFAQSGTQKKTNTRSRTSMNPDNTQSIKLQTRTMNTTRTQTSKPADKGLTTTRTQSRKSQPTGE